MKRLMRPICRQMFFAGCMALILIQISAHRVQADDDQLFTTTVPPNVMILIDTSGSMANDVPTSTYFPSTTYTVTSGTSYTSTSTYYLNSSSQWKTFTGTLSSAATTSLSTTGMYIGAISGTNYTLAKGNYLNYQNSASYTDSPKITVAQQVLTTLINSTTGVLFGLARYQNNTANYGAGNAKILATIGSSASTLITQINGLTATGSSPTGGALTDLGKYYKGTLSGYTTPIQASCYTCQPNFIIVISDGQSNDPGDPHDSGGNPTGPSTMAPAVAASLLAQTSTSTLSPTKGIVTHTIGFSGTTDAISAYGITTMQNTAANGGGQYYSASSSIQLEMALMNTMKLVIQASYEFVSPVIPTTSTTGSTRAYLASFVSSPTSEIWTGTLKAFNRDSDGNVATNSDGTPNTSSSCTVPDPSNSSSTLPCLAWNAGTLLNSMPAGTTNSPGSSNPTSRNIYTYIAGSAGALDNFQTNNTNITTSTMGGATAGVTNSTILANLIGFIRGTDTLNEYGHGSSADLPSKLGDVWHSTPVLITPPRLSFKDPAYTTFKTTNASRTEILLVGANDGMLHAFRESDGTELWAFIPPDVLPNLYKLYNLYNLSAPNTQHYYFVDGSPIVSDVKINGTWKTVAIFGERRGGDYYTCLDITDTLNPKFMWSYNNPLAAETWSEPVIGKVVMGSATGVTADSYTGIRTKYVAFVGGGNETDLSESGSGNGVLAIDIATGTTLWSYSYSTTSTTDNQFMKCSIAGNPTALDLDNDGFIDQLYIGDICGQVWKFYFTPTGAVLSGGTSGTVTNWTGKRFFAAPNSVGWPATAGSFHPDQPIYTAPAAALDTSNVLWIYFGSGDRNNPTSTASTPINRMYGVKDTSPTNTTNAASTTTTVANHTLTESDLQDVTSTNLTSTGPSGGWYIRMATTEKILSAITVFYNVVYYSAFTPTTSTLCNSGGGSSALYAVQLTSGYAAVSDWTNGTPYTASSASSASTSRSASTSIGTGIASNPVIVYDTSGSTLAASVVVATTTTKLLHLAAPAPSVLRKVLYWAEK